MSRPTTKRSLYDNAKARAKQKQVPFTITLDDIHIPQLCPVLGIPLKSGWMRTRDGSPSIDRIRPELGYVPGNIIVISHKANTIKAHATPEELERVASFYRQLLE